jgi:DNA-binding beta-propeller fold protein YncE
MKVAIDRRFSLQERSQTVLTRDSEIWTYGDRSKRLLRYSGTRESSLTPAPPLPSVSARDAAITWEDGHLLVADRLSRKVFQVDPVNEQETLIMDPAQLDFGDHDPSLLVIDTLVGDIAWHQGLLYLAVQAGYSSAIYCIDATSKRVVSHRLAPGPKPCGLDFDPIDSTLFTIDARNLELRRYSTTDKEDVVELPVELAEPRGLSLDRERGLWSVDWSTGDVLRLRVED